jgi:hypothetical protein
VLICQRQIFIKNNNLFGFIVNKIISVMIRWSGLAVIRDLQNLIKLGLSAIKKWSYNTAEDYDNHHIILHNTPTEQ